jgi:hypothetical protein
LELPRGSGGQAPVGGGTLAGAALNSTTPRQDQALVSPLRGIVTMDQSQLRRLRQQDRAKLVELLDALNGAKNSLRLDECGDPTILGSHGRITACDGVFSIYLQCGSALAWTWAKKKLAGICPVVAQDGDDEGILRLDRLPGADEAELIRRYVGIRQTRHVPAEQARSLHSDLAYVGIPGAYSGLTGPAGVSDSPPGLRRIKTDLLPPRGLGAGIGSWSPASGDVPLRFPTADWSAVDHLAVEPSDHARIRCPKWDT